LPFLPALLFSAVTALAPLKPVATIDLSSHGSFASDVAWLNNDELLVALLHGGVARVSLASKKSALWVPEGDVPEAAPYPEFVATDGELVTVMGGGRRSFLFLDKKGKYIDHYGGGRLLPRGLAVSGGKAVMMGWLAAAGDDAALKRGVLWTQTPTAQLSETPIHRIFGGDDDLKRWRLTASGYAGSVVALPDRSIAVMTVAEPGIYRYDRNGKLVEVLASGVDSLLLDTPKLAHDYNVDVLGRYVNLVNRGPLLEDLVATGGTGVAALVRTADKTRIGWELWYADKSAFTRKVALEPKALGPFGHMRCESRGTRLACVTNLPGMQQAGKPETAGANPRLFVFNLPR
jgi:hypothetical protein